MKTLSICKHCKEVIKDDAFKFGKGLFCCPEHAAAFYETIKDNPSKLRISGITEEELAKIRGFSTEKIEPQITSDVPQAEPKQEKPEEKELEEDVFEGTESAESAPSAPKITEERLEVKPDPVEVKQDLLSKEEDYLMPVYHLFKEITNGMTDHPEALQVLIERTKQISLVQLYYLLYDKKVGLIKIFNRATCYNAKGAMAYMLATALNLLKYYQPGYVTPNIGKDNIETNYYHPNDSGFQVPNNRVSFNTFFGNSNEEDDLI